MKMITTSATLIALTLVGCGDDDLAKLQQEKIDATRLAQAEAAAQTTGGSDATTDAGSVDGTDAASSTAGSDGDATDTSGGADTDGATDSDQATDAGDNSGGEGAVSGVDLSDYTLIFADEFNGTEVDAGKWNTQYVWGPDLVINGEQQHYVDVQNNAATGFNPFTFNGEHLTITAIETPAEVADEAGNQPYLSGVLSSAGKFDMTYGYIEMRAQLPAGSGVWPALWMLSSEFVDLKPQMFIMEHDGGRPDSVFHNYNYHDADGNLRSPGQREVIADGISTGFHNYAVKWSDQELLFFVDGTPTFRIIGENVSAQAMYLIINLAIGGLWTGAPQADTSFPVEYSIDYIRAYSRSEDAS